MPCGHPIITDTHYYGQNPALHPVKKTTTNKVVVVKKAIEVWLKITPTIVDSRYYGYKDSKLRPKGVPYNESWLYQPLLDRHTDQCKDRHFLSWINSHWASNIINLLALFTRSLLHRHTDQCRDRHLLTWINSHWTICFTVKLKQGKKYLGYSNVLL